MNRPVYQAIEPITREDAARALASGKPAAAAAALLSLAFRDPDPAFVEALARPRVHDAAPAVRYAASRRWASSSASTARSTRSARSRRSPTRTLRCGSWRARCTTTSPAGATWARTPRDATTPRLEAGTWQAAVLALNTVAVRDEDLAFVEATCRRFADDARPRMRAAALGGLHELLLKDHTLDVDALDALCAELADETEPVLAHRVRALGDEIAWLRERTSGS